MTQILQGTLVYLLPPLRLCVSALVFLLLVGCTAVATPPPTPIMPRTTPAIATPTPFEILPTDTAVPQPSLDPPSSTPQPTRIPDTGWEAMHPGFERRIVHLFDEDGRTLEQLYILRIDPNLYEFKVDYRPGAPQMLPDWLTQTGALAVVNGGFFTEEFLATGLIVVDGQVSGTSYGDFAGMFAVTNGMPDVRWLGERPYSPTEPIQYALQSFPILVKPGGGAGYTEDDGRPNRRTVIGMDRNGRIIIIVTPWGYFSLYSLSQYLLQSDLNLDIALNLDGGTSSGVLLANPDEQISGYVPVPSVISIYAR